MCPKYITVHIFLKLEIRYKLDLKKTHILSSFQKKAFLKHKHGIKNEKRNVNRCKVLQGKGSDIFSSTIQQAEDVKWSIFSPSLSPRANCYFPCKIRQSSI